MICILRDAMILNQPYVFLAIEYPDKFNIKQTKSKR